MNKIVSASEFKAKCLRLIDEMQTDGQPITITKRGKAVAELRLSKPDEPPKSLFGSMRGSVIIKGDILGPVCDPDWEADWEANNPPELYRTP